MPKAIEARGGYDSAAEQGPGIRKFTPHNVTGGDGSQQTGIAERADDSDTASAHGDDEAVVGDGEQQCRRNNLRQLGLALNIYVETHDQYVDDDEWQTLLDIGRNINTRASVFVCPLIKGYVLNGGQRSADGYWTYSYNAYGVIGGNWFDAHLGLGKIVSMNQVRPTKASMVKAPSAMIALGDSADRSPDRDQDGHLMLPWFMPLTVSDKRWTPMATNPNQQQPTYKNHHGLFNRVFCDSHVDSEDFNKPFDKGDDYLRRYNNDNEPHRDLWLRAGGGP